jgi:lysyl-tRNA synthetase class 2
VVVETFSALRARELQEAGWKAYPNHYPTTATIGELVAKYDSLEAGARVKDVDVRICGRITKKRESSKKLIFYEVTTSEGTMQIMASAGSYDGDFLVNRYLRKGDIIGVRGIMGKTNLGELSVIPKELFLLSPCLHELPEQLIDVNTRFRQRYLDFLVNQRNRETFVARAKMLAALRQHLQQKNFLEVETPILWTQSGGASARPFTTRSNAIGNDMDLYMRIAPELFLKELVIGGMDRYYT